MAESVGALRVDLSANSAQFGRDLAEARGHLSRTGASFQQVSGIAGSAGDAMAKGLKRGVNDFRELGAAAGLAGGEFGKLGAMLADVALTGFSPLSAALAGVGFLIGSIRTQSNETFRVQLPSALEVSKKKTEELLDLQKRWQEATLRTRAMGAGRSVDDQRDAETENGLQEELTRLLDRQRTLAAQIADVDARRVALVNTHGIEAARGAAALGREQFALEGQQRALAEQIADLTTKLDTVRAITVEQEKQTAGAAKNLAVQKETLAVAEKLSAVKPRRSSSESWQSQYEGMKKFKAEADAELKANIAGAREDYIAARQREANTLAEAGALAEKNEQLETLRLNLKGLSEQATQEFGGGPRLKLPPAMPEAQTQVHGFSAELAAMRAEMAKTDKFGVALAHRMTEGFSGDVANAFTDAAMGAKSLKDAMQDVSKSIVADLLRMSVQALFFRAIMTGFGGAAVPIPAVGGAAAAASLPVAGPTKFAMHPKVEVHNYSSNAKVGVEPSADGKSIKLMIADAVAGDVNAGGKAWQAIRDAAGLSRSARRRG